MLYSKSSNSRIWCTRPTRYSYVYLRMIFKFQQDARDILIEGHRFPIAIIYQVDVFGFFALDGRRDVGVDLETSVNDP